MDQIAQANSETGAKSDAGLIVRALVLVIDAYRFLLSPLIGQQCRFYPTCSLYSRDAFLLHGALRGLWLTLARIARCHPWATGGEDPVPRVACNRRSCSPCNPDHTD